MPWTDGRAPLDTVMTHTLPAGTRLHRCYRVDRGVLAFWPGATRFGAPPRRTLYTGTSDAAAVCETLLRDPRPYPGTNEVALPYDHLAGRGLATLELRRAVTLVNLCRPAITAVIADEEHAADVRALIETRGVYDRTCDFARTLLTQVPAMEMLAWPSQRADGHVAHCFYEGTLTAADFDVLETETFDTTSGYARLEAAVRDAGLQLVRAPSIRRPHDDP